MHWLSVIAIAYLFNLDFHIDMLDHLNEVISLNNTTEIMKSS